MDPTAQTPPPAQPVTGEQTPPQPAKKSIGIPFNPNDPTKLIMIIGGVIIFLLVIMVLVLMFKQPKEVAAPIPTPTVTPSPTPTPTISLLPTEPPVQSMQFLPNKQYYNDEVTILTKDNPHQIISVQVTRAEQQTNFLQYTAINFYDGASWNRNTLSSATTDSSIQTNTIIRNWSSAIGSANKTSPDLAVTVAYKDIVISLAKKTISDEINLVSLPNLTKFTSQGTGTVTIDGVSHDAYFVYTRSYSLNAASLSFLTNPANFTTKWVAAWDLAGNFYLVDIQKAKAGTSAYQNYQLAAIQDSKGGISRYSDAAFQQQSQNNGTYEVHFSNQILDFTYLTSLAKSAPSDPYVWTDGSMDGNVRLYNDQSGKSAYIMGMFESIQPK